jgi:hypothetical protein
MTLTPDVIWTIVSFILTLMVFSYLFGDNLVFRFVSALFVGAAAGYFFAVLFYQVIMTRLYAPIRAGSYITLIPLFLSGLLLLKLSPRLSKFGNVSMAYLVGTGAAVAIGGAAMGTLLGQGKGSALPFFSLTKSTPLTTILELVFLFIGTLATLIYFNFGAKKNPNKGPRRGGITAVFAWIGQFFIAITLGAVFAGVLTAAVTALIERSDFILQTLKSFLH